MKREKMKKKRKKNERGIAQERKLKSIKRYTTANIEFFVATFTSPYHLGLE